MKNKILIATGIFPPDIGGPATMLAHLARSLTERGFEVQVLTYCVEANKREYQRERTRSADYKVFRVNINSVFAKVKYFLKMLKLSKWSEVIYVTDTYSVGRFAGYIKKLLGKPYILRFTGDSAWETARANGWTENYIMDFNSGCHSESRFNRDEESRGIQKKINKLKKHRDKILVNANQIIVDCEFNKKLAEMIINSVGTRRRLVQDDKIHIIYNAIDFKDDKIDKDAVQQIKDKYPGKIILTACRLTPWKGVDKIIETLPELKEKIGELNLLILGDGSESEKLKMKSEKLKVDNIYFLGRVKRDELVNYFAAADVFVLNSQYEGLSHTLLEVMKIGTPIITTNCGGNPELISNNSEGTLVEYGNNEQLLNALEKVLNNRELADKFSQSAKEKVKKFKWSEVVEGTKNVILSVAERSEGSRGK